MIRLSSFSKAFVTNIFILLSAEELTPTSGAGDAAAGDAAAKDAAAGDAVALSAEELTPTSRDLLVSLCAWQSEDAVFS